MEYSRFSIQPSIQKKETAAWKAVAAVLLFVCSGIGVLFFVLAYYTPQSTFPQTVTISKGSSIRSATNVLASRNIIATPRLLELYINVVENGKVVSGDYLFQGPAPLVEVARRITQGQYGESQIRITIPEGSTIKDIARIADAALPNFDSEVFLAIAKGKEGYLFPDTYFFFPSVTELELVQRLERNFNDHIEELRPALDASKRSLAEIVTMASIIEREAYNDPTEQAMISGILWKRIEIGMLLQVDAPFWYLIGKGSSELTVNDLKMDSRYNTYKYKGLPPGPIGNPGIAALTAALHPIQSEYLFYLHDKSGIVHYAVTHNQHVNNKNKYLK